MHRLPSPAKSLRPALIAMLLALPLTAYAADAAKQPAAAKSSSASSSDPVVIKVNGTEVHRSEIVELQKSLGQQAAGMPLGEFYQRVADRLIVNTLLTDAAKSAKLDSDPEVKAKLAKALEQIETQVWVNRVEAKAASDEAVKALYEKTIKNNPDKQELRARHILVKTEDEAKAVVAELDKGGDFAKLADEKSIEQGKNGGELGWFDKSKMVPEFSEAAFKLKKGEYSKTPVKSQFGWHVIMVEDMRTPSFEDSAPALREQLGKQAVEEKLKDLEGKAKVERFALDGSPLPPPAPAPAPAPAAGPTLAPAPDAK
jgi:peptidyl-prolyl cis-trans isomerase C